MVHLRPYLHLTSGEFEVKCLSVVKKNVHIFKLYPKIQPLGIIDHIANKMQSSVSLCRLVNLDI